MVEVLASSEDHRLPTSQLAPDIFSLSANELAERLREGEISAVEVCSQYIERIGKFEKDVKAPVNGYVFCINHAPIVNKGDAIIHMSKEK